MIEHRRPHVLLVDDEIGTIELLGAVLQRQGFQVDLASTTAGAIALLRTRTFDAVVTDVVFDGRDEGQEVLSACRDLAPGTAVMLMTGHPALEGAVSAIKLGAVDYLQKPVDPVLLAARIHRAVRERQMGAPDDLNYKDLVNILSDLVAQTIERVDPYTAGHGERTRNYCRQIAEKFGLDKRTVERLELAAIAHDYGKIYLDDLTFLTKKGPLTPNEYREVQRHPEVGANKLGTNPHLVEACRYVAEHHERWDGTGYPRGLRGEEIPRSGRIVAVADVFDALISARSYKPAWSLERARAHLEAEAGRHFDPACVAAFLSRWEDIVALVEEQAA